jgi:hypothetical protein
MSIERQLQSRARVLLLCILAALAIGCNNSVAIVLAGPLDLDGAEILIDGHKRTVFQRTHSSSGPSDGVLAEVSVPLGTHRLEVRKGGKTLFTRELNYSTRGEDYISVGPQPKDAG